MKSFESKMAENELYLHLVQDALDDAKKYKTAFVEEVTEMRDDFKKLKEFMEWAGLESIYKKWETNEQLSIDEYEPLDFDEMYYEEAN